MKTWTKTQPIGRIPTQVDLFAFSLCWGVLLFLGIAGCTGGAPSTEPGQAAPVTILNVSYDPTREFYEEFNSNFADYWAKSKGQTVTIEQSHGGSGKQARAVIDGLQADVVTLALAQDIQAIADKGIIKSEWQQGLSKNSAPYTSTIVFLVRKGNPKQIKDWADLIKGDVQVITANPKTGGGARWNYLAAWGAVLKQELGDLKKLHDPAAAEAVKSAQAKARDYMVQLYKHVPVMDPAARAATNTFVQREIGDVLISWENEAFLAVKNFGPDKYEIVVPGSSILAEPPVAVVDQVVDKRGTREVAEAYLRHLYSPQGQQLAAKHFYRPVNLEQISAEQRDAFAKVELFTIDDVFGGWPKAQAAHFNDGGEFDGILQASRGE
ncbi:MAG: sulfate ABC transporter substrate-binding protein [Pirellulales bacterium]|nr:sulfate ABC transporter substrate-binding protein [Pirellulales bacterium]